MSIVEVLRVGDVDTTLGPAPIYLVRVDGRVLDVRVGGDDAAVLREVARTYQTADRRCTSEMASTASEHGFRVSPWTAELRAERAIAAVVAATNGAFDRVSDRDAIEALLVASTALERAAIVGGLSVFAVDQSWLEGAVCLRFSSSVVVLRSIGAHLALFASTEAANRFVDVVTRRAFDAARTIDRVSVARVRIPRGLGSAVADLTGESSGPQPWRWIDGVREPIDDADCRALAATAFAIASSQQGNDSYETTIGARRIAIDVRFESQSALH